MKNRQRGMAILEFAVILPVFVFIGFGLMDMQWSLAEAGNLNYVVSETARCMAIHGPACASNPSVYARQVANGLKMDLSNLTMVSNDCNPNWCTVVMTYRFTPLGVYFPDMIINRTGMAAVGP